MEYTAGTSVMLGIGPALQIYPWPDEGLSFDLRLGYGREDWAHTGLFVGGGAGFGFWIGDEWSLGPTASLLYFRGSGG